MHNSPPWAIGLAGLSGLLVVVAVTTDPRTPLPYLVAVGPLVVGLTWWRPVWGFAGLLGLVLISEQRPETLAAGVEPFLLQGLPLFENIRDYTPLSFVYANVVELWLVLVIVVWLLRGIQQGDLRLRPVPCPMAYCLAAGTIALTFVLGVSHGGDLKTALWEVRTFGYLFGLSWLLSQIVTRRRDLRLILWVLIIGLGTKALQGLYFYFIVLRMQLDLEATFLAHEDPVMFIPLFFLLIGLLHHRTAPRLTRALAVATPIMLAGLVLTQRRVAYIVLPLSAVFFAILLAPAARRTFARYALPMVAVGAFYVFLYWGSASPLGMPIARALQLFDSDNTSNNYRVVELEDLRYTVRAHPWGLGFGQPFETPYSLPKVWVFWDTIPHNQIVWIWVKSGTPGFILVMFYFARLVAESTWAYRRLREPLLRVVASVIGLVIIGQLVASYYDVQLTFGRNMMYFG
ncbi:MAG: hypothetical protein DMD79_26770, partial [Candidatus Rokuibacteriota bacterium]